MANYENNQLAKLQMFVHAQLMPLWFEFEKVVCICACTIKSQYNIIII